MTQDNALPPVTVIIPARNEGKNLIDTARYVLQNSQYDALEVIVVDDGSSDGSIEQMLDTLGIDQVRVVAGSQTGVAQARNRGAEEAHGDILVFLDGHCYVPPGWLGPLVSALSLDKAGLVGPAFTNIRDSRMRACGITWHGPDLQNVWLPCTDSVTIVPFHIGACQAVPAAVFRQVGGYDPGMYSWGSEDIELCLRLWLLGYQVYAQPASLVYHLFRTNRPYEVNTEQILYNHLRLTLMHFDEAYLARAIRVMLAWPGIERVLARAFSDDTPARRQTLFSQRQRNFDWFCQQFHVPI